MLAFTDTSVTAISQTIAKIWGLVLRPRLFAYLIFARIKGVLLSAIFEIANRRDPCDAYFVSFASSKWETALARVGREARRSFYPERIKLFREQDLGVDFWDAHARFIDVNRRGYGYWIWKPYIIGQALADMPEGAVLVYTDAGCMINASTPAAVNRLRELVASTGASSDGFTAFLVPGKCDPREGSWTKREALLAFGVDNPEMRESRQLMATAMLIKNTKTNRRFVADWYRHCSKYDHVNDQLTGISQHPEFVEHRHDQSLYSLLIKTRKDPSVTILEDEIETLRWNDPIWAMRRNY